MLIQIPDTLSSSEIASEILDIIFFGKFFDIKL